MKNKFFLMIIFALLLLGAGAWFALLKNKKNSKPVVFEIQTQAEDTQIVTANKPSPDISVTTPETSNTIIKKIQMDAPFVVQAPFANWKESIFQNACEEASIVMAMGWLKNVKTITPAEAQKQILEIVAYENRAFGYDADTDVFDVQKIFQQYFHQQNVSVKERISIVDIQNELQKGNLVLVPAFGRALGNPNFTAPGPIVHMLLIIGYDSDKKEFITNDPGTKKGAGYVYNEKILFDAIWQYASGKDVPTDSPVGILKKSMLVLEK